MSKNYYALTKDKSLIEKYGLIYELTDNPDWGYWIHIVQTTCEYKPLYQEHDYIKNIDDLLRFLKESNIFIYDEYYNPLPLEEFIKEVIEDNYYNNEAKSRQEDFKSGYFYNNFHIDYKGYEFCKGEFL